MKKKILAIALSVTTVLALYSVSAGAATYSVTDNGGGNLSTGDAMSYAASWELTKYFDGSNGIMRFGFGTAGINNDYVTVYHATKPHYGKVVNASKGPTQSASAAAGQWSTSVKITHDAKPTWSSNY